MKNPNTEIRVVKTYRLRKSVAERLARLVEFHDLPEASVVALIITQAHNQIWKPQDTRLTPAAQRRKDQADRAPFTSRAVIRIHEGRYYEYGPVIQPDGTIKLGYAPQARDDTPSVFTSLPHTITRGDVRRFLAEPPPPHMAWTNPPGGMVGVDYDLSREREPFGRVHDDPDHGVLRPGDYMTAEEMDELREPAGRARPLG